MRYMEKTTRKVVDDILAVHTQRRYEKQGLRWEPHRRLFDSMGNEFEGVTTIVRSNVPLGVPSVGGEAQGRQHL